LLELLGLLTENKVLKNDGNGGFELLALYGDVLAHDLVHPSLRDK